MNTAVYAIVGKWSPCIFSTKVSSSCLEFLRDPIANLLNVTLYITLVLEAFSYEMMLKNKRLT